MRQVHRPEPDMTPRAMVLLAQRNMHGGRTQAPRASPRVPPGPRRIPRPTGPTLGMSGPTRERGARRTPPPEPVYDDARGDMSQAHATDHQGYPADPYAPPAVPSQRHTRPAPRAGARRGRQYAVSNEHEPHDEIDDGFVEVDEEDEDDDPPTVYRPANSGQRYGTKRARPGVPRAAVVQPPPPITEPAARALTRRELATRRAPPPLPASVRVYREMAADGVVAPLPESELPKALLAASKSADETESKAYAVFHYATQGDESIDGLLPHVVLQPIFSPADAAGARVRLYDYTLERVSVPTSTKPTPELTGWEDSDLTAGKGEESNDADGDGDDEVSPDALEDELAATVVVTSQQSNVGRGGRVAVEMPAMASVIDPSRDYFYRLVVTASQQVA